VSWIAVLPLKGEGERKTRLAEVLNPAERDHLALTMARHVVAVLADSKILSRILLLSPAPVDIDVEWIADGGEGLNAELTKVRAQFAGRGFCAIHPDLPFLRGEDVAALVNAASDGIAIAPDRRDAGTNAVALASNRPFDFAFGPGSFAAHRGASGAIVRRNGLGFDVDTPADLAEARERGLTF
jgi:2-phospho-L-lactate guanylyltransferase